jgi:hypothetical protein
MNSMLQSPLTNSNVNKPKSYLFLFDLLIYISVMFLIREVYFTQLHFIANGLFWSTTTLLVAIWIMRIRGVTWKDLGLCQPENYSKTLLATVFILGFSILLIILFQMIKDNLGLQVIEDTSEKNAASKFGELQGNWLLFFSIIPFIWLESLLEEVLDRGFLLNWIEKMLSSTWFATVIAVITQAIIFGFRHSHDFSERSITVGLLGLGMGIGYILFGRNLWPLILAHCLLNTSSMIGRVL